jgi:hypothetical protein
MHSDRSQTYTGAATLPRLSKPAPATRPRRTPQRRLLICTQDQQNGELIRVVAEALHWQVATIALEDWLRASESAETTPDVILLDPWPLRDAVVLQEAKSRLSALPSALVLLVDPPFTPDLREQLDVATTIPLFFTLDELADGLELAMKSNQKPDPGIQNDIDARTKHVMQPQAH